jgi:hypothetical protein
MTLFIYNTPKPREDTKEQNKRTRIDASYLLARGLRIRRHGKVLNSATNSLQQISSGDGWWVLKWGKLSG